MGNFQTDSYEIAGRKWKELTCSGCGAVYRHSFGKNLVLPNEINLSPCPHCGLIPLEMLGASRAYLHGRMSVVSLGTGILGFFLSSMERRHYYEMALFFVASALLIVAIHLAALLFKTNVNLSANLSRAQRLVRDGDLALERPGTRATPERVPKLG